MTDLKLSIVIPVYNEKDLILKLLKKVEETIKEEKEIVIVDDYSTDGTREVLKNLEKENRCKIFYHEKNMGKGAALRTGFSNTTGEIIMIQDADLEYDPADYKVLIAPIINDKADVVYGSRFSSGHRRVLFFWHYVGNKMLTTFSNMMTNLNLSDMETCYKIFKREVLEKITLKSNRFGFEPEFTAKIAKNNFRIYEVPISYHGRDYSEGKKITWKDGFVAIWCIIKYHFFD